MVSGPVAERRRIHAQGKGKFMRPVLFRLLLLVGLLAPLAACGGAMAPSAGHGSMPGMGEGGGGGGGMGGGY